MTCVAVQVQSGAISMSGDSALICSPSGVVHRAALPKVFRREVRAGLLIKGTRVELLIGCSGDEAYATALRFRVPWWDLVMFVTDDDVDTWVYTQLADAVQKARKARESECSGNTLIAFYFNGAPRIYELCDDNATRIRESYWAIGCGKQLAIGALAAGVHILRALEISSRHHDGVRTPFHEETIELPVDAVEK